MKKFLTVLLVIAVMFTFSFGSAMAAPKEYSVDDYYTALQAEKTAQLSYLANAKAQAVAGYSYNNLGFVKVDFSAAEADDAIAGYSKAAIEAAADAVIEDLTKAMDEAIHGELNTADKFPTTEAPDKTVVSDVTVGKLTADGMKTELQKKTDVLAETQAPLTKKLVEEKLAAIDLTKYNSTDKTATYDDKKVTPAEKVQALIDVAKDAIAKAAKEETDAKKLAGYEKAYSDFVKANDVKTLEDEAFDSIGDAQTLDDAVNAFVAMGLDSETGYVFVDLDAYKSAADHTEDYSSVATGAYKAFWEENSKGSKGGKFFGVEIKNIGAVTRTEASALYTAIRKAINDAATPVKAYGKTLEKEEFEAGMEALADDYLATLKNAMDAAEKYADVVKAGEKLKARYDWGVKQYDEAKVDEAVKAAEEFVYADLVDGFEKNAENYIAAAANDIYDNGLGLANLKLDAAKYEYDKFVEAVEKAAKKMYEDGLTATKPAKKVSVGADKTPEADLVYLQGTYYPTTNNIDWAEIAEDTVAKLKDAQSYDEITSIMNEAAAEFGKLLKADDKDDVDKAIEVYQNSLKAYGDQKKAVLDTTVYDPATVDAAVEAGKDLIADATSVEGVKAAYAEAQKLVDGVKTKAELKAMKEAIEKQIAALPYTAKLTVADKEAVKAAYDAYVAYADTPGTAEVTVTTLVDKYNRVNELEKEAIDEEAEALKKKLDAVDSRSDADLPAYIALKAEALALVAKGTALADEIKAVNEDEYLGENALNAVDFCEEYDAVEAATSVALAKKEDNFGDTYYETDGEFHNQEIVYAQTLLMNAMKEGATTADMKAALEAFNKLTQRQQYELDGNTGYYLQAAKVIEAKMGEVVKSLKIKASSKATKGAITVKWTVKGDATAADGYQIWKSTKMNKGYKKAFTTTKMSYKNSKGLKKGVKYYYKVRAYKVVDGKNVYSDWSNKAYRVAK